MKKIIKEKSNDGYVIIVLTIGWRSKLLNIAHFLFDDFSGVR